MLDLKRAGLWSSALRQLSLRFLGHVVAVHLSLVAGLTEVRGAPAEPLRYRAAEAALELYVVRAVLAAVGRACSQRDGGALAAHQVFLLVLLALFLSTDAVLHASEVRHFALEALIVGELVERELLQIVIVLVVGVFEPWVVVQVFKLSPFLCLFHHIGFDSLCFLEFSVQRLAVRGLDPALAAGAVQEAEDYTGPRPSSLDLGVNALVVIDVLAL